MMFHLTRPRTTRLGTVVLRSPTVCNASRDEQLVDIAAGKIFSNRTNIVRKSCPRAWLARDDVRGLELMENLKKAAAPRESLRLLPKRSARVLVAQHSVCLRNFAEHVGNLVRVALRACCFPGPGCNPIHGCAIAEMRRRESHRPKGGQANTHIGRLGQYAERAAERTAVLAGEQTDPRDIGEQLDSMFAGRRVFERDVTMAQRDGKISRHSGGDEEAVVRVQV